MIHEKSSFDVIVVGAGHAGVEASLVNARLGLKTLLVTTNLDRIGYMSCNPSIGGLAKGHMVREIDVLGGQMGIAADRTCIQFKRLNATKGPAVRGSRVQNDKDKYSQFMSSVLRTTENLVLMQAEVKSLIIENHICRGVLLNDGSEIRSKATIVTTGTFLNGVMHTGLKQEAGGRVGDKASIGISDQLRNYGFDVKRLKTGTPARLIKSSIDWDKTTPQYGDSTSYPFSFRSPKDYILPQVACYLSRTNEKTHEIIRSNLHLSPMYCGVIEGVGPRYCPSIEDKIVRFSERDGHQTFLEPEGLDSELIYLQGISTSLPEDVQMQFLKTIPGLENVKVARFGYAVEYDYFEPTQIWHSLETRPIKSLFLAGQINGTSGYEEAAAQGFIAGINAAHKIQQKSEFVLGREEAYIGVMIDDLVTKGTKEPYRMFTSRAEHRLVLREDNTLDRLYDRSVQLGLINSETLQKVNTLREKRHSLQDRLESTKFFPTQEMQVKLQEVGTPVLKKSIFFSDLLRRPEINCLDLIRFGFDVDLDPNVHEPVEISVKYSGYIKRQMDLIDQSKRLEDLLLPTWIDYTSIRGLSNEEVEKLGKIKPRTLGQAQRISGVNPSAVQAIMIYLRGKSNLKGISVEHSER